MSYKSNKSRELLINIISNKGCMHVRTETCISYCLILHECDKIYARYSGEFNLMYNNFIKERRIAALKKFKEQYGEGDLFDAVL